MIYWFGIPRDQTPVGQVTFSIINKMEQAQLMVVWAQVQAHLCLNFGKPLMELNHLWLIILDMVPPWLPIL